MTYFEAGYSYSIATQNTVNMLAFCLINVVESRIVGATTPVGLFFFFSIVCIAERAEILRGIDNTSLLNELRNR